jgi:hypothetical protein
MNLLDMTKEVDRLSRELHGKNHKFSALNALCLLFEVDGHTVEYTAYLHLRNEKVVTVKTSDYLTLPHLIREEYNRAHAEVTLLELI